MSSFKNKHYNLINRFRNLCKTKKRKLPMTESQLTVGRSNSIRNNINNSKTEKKYQSPRSNYIRSNAQDGSSCENSEECKLKLDRLNESFNYLATTDSLSDDDGDASKDYDDDDDDYDEDDDEEDEDYDDEEDDYDADDAPWDYHDEEDDGDDDVSKDGGGAGGDDKRSFQFTLIHTLLLPKDFRKPIAYYMMTKLSAGSSNIVYKVIDKKKNSFALRCTKYDLEPEFRQEALDEAILTLRLASLGITPYIYDIFFARDDNKEVKLYIISELSNNGSLLDFVTNKSFSNLNLPTIKKISSDIITLYERMIQNKVFCIDVKYENMLTHKISDNNYKITIIDFDTIFCSAANSIITLDNLITNITNNKNNTLIKYDSDYIKSLLIYINIFQLCVPRADFHNDNNLIILKNLLIKHIKLESLPDIIKIIDSEVGVGDRNSFFMIEYYSNDYFSRNFKQIKNNDLITNENLICSIYYLAYYGANDHGLNVIQNLKNGLQGVNLEFLNEKELKITKKN
jgi:hypothetical protein